MLSLIAFTWWKLSTPPAFAQFVYKAGGEVEFLGRGRIGEFVQISQQGKRVAVMRIPNPADDWKYRTSKPLLSVVLALADQIGDENITLSQFGARGRIGETYFNVQTVRVRGIESTSVIVSKPFTTTALDKSLNGVWSGWIGFRYGRPQTVTGIRDNPGFVGPWISEQDIRAIRKLRPKIRLARKESQYPPIEP